MGFCPHESGLELLWPELIRRNGEASGGNTFGFWIAFLTLSAYTTGKGVIGSSEFILLVGDCGEEFTGKIFSEFSLVEAASDQWVGYI